MAAGCCAYITPRAGRASTRPTPTWRLASGTEVLTTWYDLSQLHARQTFQRGQRKGDLLVYYPNGRLKRSTQYVAGNELPGSCFDPAGQPVPFFPYEQLPLYPGGEAQLTKELIKAVCLPCLTFKPGSYVLIGFQVLEDWLMEAPRVAASSQVPVLDQAVLTAVGRLSWRLIPARREGQLVPGRYQLPVRMSLDYPLG
ncbi:MAG: energy transducer TonB [Hymenobacter sp.]